MSRSKVLGLFGLIVLILSLVIYNEVEFITERITLPDSAHAKCLDGSNYSFHLIRGSGSGADKFLISFAGAGWCGGSIKNRIPVEACRQRAHNPFGKSVRMFDYFFPRVRRLHSSKPKFNPEFYNWNKVFVHYCDGFGQLSNKNAYGLYFNGLNNTLGVLDYLSSNLRFKDADKVIVTGFSSGGISAMTWTNYIDSITTKKNNTFLLVDSGVFYNEPNNGKGITVESIFKGISKYFGDVSKIMNTFCKIKNKEEEWKCFEPENFFSTIHVPILIIQNLYESAGLVNFMNENCFFNWRFVDGCGEEDVKVIKEFGKEYEKNFRKLVKEHKNIAIWTPKHIGHILCSIAHGWDTQLKVNNVTMMEMIVHWYKDSSQGIQSQYTNGLFIDSEDTIKNYRDLIYFAKTSDLVEIVGF